MASADDRRWMRRALRLAARGRYTVAPNPRVGAVVVRDGEVVGEGWHRGPGEPHAEAEALAEAGGGTSGAASGATLYVNLEPCNHHGRTPPCTEAVLAAGIARVVACHRDPNPRVEGGGFARLAAADVEVVDGVLAEEGAELNLAFLVPAVLGRPAVTLKWAMSLDGKIATAAGDSRWISSPKARRWALALREEHDAIAIGSGTALADDPRLDRRLGLAPGPIVRVVLDRRLRLPPDAAMLGIAGPVLVYTESDDPARRSALEARGAEVVRLPEAGPAAVLADLYGRGVGSLLVEGGGEVAAAFVAAGLFDRVHAVVAPLLVGGRSAPSPLGGAGAGPLAQAPRLDRLSVRRLGPDHVLGGLRPETLRELRALL